MLAALHIAPEPYGGGGVATKLNNVNSSTNQEFITKYELENKWRISYKIENVLDCMFGFWLELYIPSHVLGLHIMTFFGYKYDDKLWS